MYNACEVARYIIASCNSHKKIISNLKLQKILYFVQAEFLVSKDVPCFSEQIEAWDFGPVVPDVYNKYKVYGGGNIRLGDNISTGISKDDQELLNGIIDTCVKYSASALVDITHRQTPWRTAYKPKCNCVITNKSIKDFFK